MKKFLILFLLIPIIFFLLLGSIKDTKYYNKILIISDFLFPEMISSTIRMISNNRVNAQRIKNDYNKLFLPDTQYAKVELIKIPLDFIKISDVGYLNVFKRKSFYIDIFKDYLIVMPKNGNFYFKSIDLLMDEDKKFKKIKSNISNTNALDLYIDKNEIYISYVREMNKCKYLYLAKANIDLKELIFKDIFSIKNECMNNIQGGRIQKLFKNDKSYILLSTSANSLEKEDQSDDKPQSENSLYGKIIAIDNINKLNKIYSKGHRNIIGLSVIENIILATENGPYGGDEINLIKENENYGWDIASHGKKYSTPEDEGEYKNHEENGYQEPIFSFIPSLGISEIIKIDNNFDKDWKNNYLIGSLNHKHILRIKMNKDYSKLEYYEDIYIGERIRDLKYYIKNSTVFMALENSGSIGILKKLNN
jgi:hypothetical protein